MTPARRRRLGVVAVLVLVPPMVNLATGLRPVWTGALPDAVLRTLADAGLLDLWLMFDLLTASGVLGGLAIVTLAIGWRSVTAVALGLVAAVSLACLAADLDLLSLAYGLAYAPAAALSRPFLPQRAWAGGLTLTRRQRVH